MTVAVLLHQDGSVVASVSGNPVRSSASGGGGNGGGGNGSGQTGSAGGSGKDNGANSRLSDELIATIMTFRKTAASFGATLQHVDSPAIHVRGKATLFSCYDVDKHVRLDWS